MSKNTSVSLGNHFDDFINNTISNGRFKNASEVLRAGLRLLEEEEHKIVVLKNTIREGMESGLVTDFNPDEHLALLKAKKNNG